MTALWNREEHRLPTCRPPSPEGYPLGRGGQGVRWCPARSDLCCPNCRLITCYPTTLPLLHPGIYGYLRLCPYSAIAISLLLLLLRCGEKCNRLSAMVHFCGIEVMLEKGNVPWPAGYPTAVKALPTWPAGYPFRRVVLLAGYPIGGQKM